MRIALKMGMLALLASTSLISVRANAAMPGVDRIAGAVEDVSILDHVQRRFHRGRNYCWYFDGWRGPGWYWCDYQWRRGYGWGGGFGWRGWGGGHHGRGGRGGGGWGGGHHGGGGGGMGGGGGVGGGGGGGMGGGGGGMGGGGGGGGMGMGMSDIRAKHAITELGRLANGLGFYRFSYLGSDQAYVGVMAQEVEAMMPDAVVRGSDGYLRVLYGKLGFPMQTWEDWLAAGARVPTPTVH
jgi:hypothetical protein